MKKEPSEKNRTIGVFASFISERFLLEYINVLLIQQVLASPKHFQQMKQEDLRALTPLIYSHVTPYGTFRLDLSERIQIEEVVDAPSFFFPFLSQGLVTLTQSEI